jgi:hypothetical protein
MPERNLATSAGGTSVASESHQHEPEKSTVEIATHNKPSSHNRVVSSHHRGGTIIPQYGERRPLTYHVFETELEAISSLNAEALRYFSFGSFFVAMAINIIISYAFSNGPISELGNLMLYRATPATGVLALICFGFGVWAILKRRKMIDRIKSETESPSSTIGHI